MAEVERQLAGESGLLGVSGVGCDMRDVREAALGGNSDAQLAVDLFVHEIRRWASSFLFELGGLEGLVFTAGIGENNPWLREEVCAGLEEFGISLDPVRNADLRGDEGEISEPGAKVKVFVIPANEELVLAREVYRKVSDLN